MQLTHVLCWTDEQQESQAALQKKVKDVWGGPTGKRPADGRAKDIPAGAKRGGTLKN